MFEAKCCQFILNGNQALWYSRGMRNQLIKQITMNSNDYVNKWKVNNCFGGSIWKPIKVQEIYHGLGIILKISIDNCQLGGIISYFNPPQTMRSGPSHMIKVIGFSTWAAGRMLEFQFILICAWLHSEIITSSVGNLCHQLCASILSINAFANQAFVLEFIALLMKATLLTNHDTNQ